MPSSGRCLSVMLLLFLFACYPNDKAKNSVILWTAFEGAELSTLRSSVEEFEASHGIDIEILKVPFPQLQRKVLVAGPALQGPDLLLGPHDWIGILQTADLLAPIPPDVVAVGDSSFYEISTRAVTYDQTIYSAPMMLECVVLARNTKLCPVKPTSLDALVEEAVQCVKRNPEALGFAYQLDNFYFSWAFMAGFGADFLAPFAEANLSLENLEFDTRPAVEGATWIANLRGKYKLVPPGLKNDTAVELFLKGRLGMMICGPWNLGAMRAAGVPFVLEPLPPGPAKDSSPFVGVTGAMLSRYATEKKGVHEVLEFLVSPELTARLCQSSGRAPARKATTEILEREEKDPAVIAALKLFSEAAQSGTPLPNHPAMAGVWAPMEEALELITTGQTEAGPELKRTTERVRAKIRFMTE